LEIKPWTDAKPGDAALAVADAALEEGVITRNIGEAVCFCPPLIITAVQINDLFASIGRALDKVAKRRV
jgi:4-aminobutyrate--pyruvate transaminase